MSRSEGEADLTETSLNSRFGAIDLGSHTLRLLVAELRNRSGLTPLHSDRRITRLAQGFLPRETLGESAMARSIEVLKEYARVLETLGAATVVCGATGVLRRASNAKAFLDRINRESGLSPSVLSEEEEAFLSAKGILSVLSKPAEWAILFDLGGSSTEFTLLQLQQPERIWCTSIFLGAATLSERFLQGDPPGSAAVGRAFTHVATVLKPVVAHIRRLLNNRDPSSQNVMLVGTAGTVTTLAAMKLEMSCYQPHRVNGLTLEHDWVVRTIARLGASTLEQRRRMAGLEPGREDILLGGAVVVRGILEGLNLTEMVVTDAGLLEGLLLHGAETALGRPKSLVSPLTWQTEKG